MIIDRVTTDRGELVLRRDGEHFEVISNGTFLMDTRAGASERLLVTAARHARPRPRTMLIGGLGVGFSLVEALRDPRLSAVTVIEIEPALLDWHRRHLAGITAAALADPRTTIVIDDVMTHLAAGTSRYDAICLDVDNGPQWTVTEANAGLYDADGTALLARRLAPRGVLAVWSAARSPGYETVLRNQFGAVEVHEVPVSRGVPDVVMVATKVDPAGDIAS